MKYISHISSLVSGIVATALLALGLHGVAQRVDPVAQKTTSASSMDLGKASSLPCIDSEFGV